MSATSGVSDQVLSLPTGGGSLRSLGESFRADLHTGTGSYTVPLDLPAGPGAVAPRLVLHYHTAAGTGPFGLGFTMDVLTIQRSTAQGTPTYTASDRLIFAAVGELVEFGNVLRPAVETFAWRITRFGDGFEVRDQNATVHSLGGVPEARVTDAAGGSPGVFAWLVNRTVDAFGNRVDYRYRRDRNRLYVDEIAYSIYTVRFVYENRPDVSSSGRSGFLVTTALLCTQIELWVDDGAPALARQWELGYVNAGGNGVSLLTSVRLTGFDRDGNALSAPTLSLEYRSVATPVVTRITPAVAGASPPPFERGDVELVDWQGDALPDFLTTRGGYRVFRNAGNGVIDHPERIPRLPLPVTLASTRVAFGDFEGKGTADLLSFGERFEGYYPLRPGGGYERPVFWRRAPSLRFGEPAARLVDLDGDGGVDLLFTGREFFELYYRTPAGDWAARPQTIPRHAAPPVSLADRHVRLADMNGDGLQDLVRVDGRGVSYWPYLGLGRWADEVRMASPPRLPDGAEAGRWFLVDLDGDGCADLLYVGFDRLMWWLNRAGAAFGPMQTLGYIPRTSPQNLRMADMLGRGTVGPVWSTRDNPRRRTEIYYADFAPTAKPYVLTRITNGLGAESVIEYAPSSAEAARDAAVGRAWATFLPFPVHVVSSVTTTDTVTGRVARGSYAYHDGHYDGQSRQFAGFGYVEVTELGDGSLPTVLTRNWHHLGRDPNDLRRALTEADRQRFAALRGRLLRSEIFALDGDAREGEPYLRVSNTWEGRDVAAAGNRLVVFPLCVETMTQHLDRQDTAYRINRSRAVAIDDGGNVTERRDTFEDPGNPGRTRTIMTTSTFARDANGVRTNRPTRVTERDDTGAVLSDSAMRYDDLAEGTGSARLLTASEKLVLPDALVADVYGDRPPDFAAFSYHRRVASDGWWIYDRRYRRFESGGRVHVVTTDPRGSQTEVEFDAGGIFPERLVDARRNEKRVRNDYRCGKIVALVDTAGVTLANSYDALARPLTVVEPGASAALPTMRYEYDTARTPTERRSFQRAVNGEAATIDRRQLFDGFGHVIEERVQTDSGEVVTSSIVFNRLGKAAISSLPHAPTAAHYDRDFAARVPVLHTRYDALGRRVGVTMPDGAESREVYAGATRLTLDAEDLNPAGRHRDTPTRVTVDVTGAISEVALRDGARWIATRYEHDLKGRLLVTEHPDGTRAEVTYDLLGHPIRTTTVESASTVQVFDPAGDVVERRDADGHVLRWERDEVGRPRRARADGALVATYIYDDGDTAGAGTGSFTRGRLARVEEPSGNTEYGYDELGRVTRRSVASAFREGNVLDFRYEYRADGQRSLIKYPAIDGAPELSVTYRYDRRALLKAVPGFVNDVVYDAAGHRTSVTFANGVAVTDTFYTETGRARESLTTAPDGTTLQHFVLNYDSVGNVKTWASDLADAPQDMTYDDLYRLRTAESRSGQAWRYQYNDVGDFTLKSDVGDYRYGERGLPARLLTSAGADQFSYSAAGRLTLSGTGTFTYDAYGRLVRLERGDDRVTTDYWVDDARSRIVTRRGGAITELLCLGDGFEIENGVAAVYVSHDPWCIARLSLDTGERRYLHRDHLGSVTLVTDAAGRQVARRAYDPFGGVIAAGASTLGARFGFTGAPVDEWWGLVFLSYRYYHPGLGRFTSPDSFVVRVYDPASWNRYSYVRNNPLRYVDPTGMFWEEVLLGVAIVAVVVAAVALSVLVPGLGVTVSGVLIGMAFGGLFGGIVAYESGADILRGVMIGMLIGGVGAIAGEIVATAIIAPTSFGTYVANGAIAGAVSGIGSPFATSLAGGHGLSDVEWTDFLESIPLGAAGGAVGALANTGWASLRGEPMPWETSAAASSAARSQSRVISQANEATAAPETAADIVAPAATGPAWQPEPGDPLYPLWELEHLPPVDLPDPSIPEGGGSIRA